MDRAEGGLGLGLAIVRSLVNLHGGTVEANSAGTGAGSEFIVHLPLRPDQPLVAKPRRPRDSAGSKTRALASGVAPGVSWRVLVVDDNQDAAELLAEALTDQGHLVRIAYDGAAALEAIETEKPDVALLDIGLPVMNGYELARRIRNDPALCSMRLLAVTGYGQAKDRAEAVRAGFDAHLVRPVNLSTLEAELLRIMSQPPQPPT